MKLTHLTVATVAVVLIAFLVAGCGGGKKADDPPEADPASASLKFVRCLREHGVDAPDPAADGSISIPVPGPGGSGGPVAGPDFQRAQKACAKYAPQQSLTPGSTDGIAKAALAFAKCMRRHGVSNFPDPQVQDGQVMVGGPQAGLDTPAARKAAAACQKFLSGPGSPAPQ
jgi:hypothetical protein